MPDLLNKIKELKGNITGAITGAVSDTAKFLTPDSLFQNTNRFAQALSKIKKTEPEEKPFVEASNSVIPGIDIGRAEQVIVGHEGRGEIDPVKAKNIDTGATGLSQITKPLFADWQKKHARDKEFAKTINFEDLQNNKGLQELVTKDSMEGVASEYSFGLPDWPTSTKKLKEYKNEIFKNFHHPIYWLAGQWVGGPNWVAKLDSLTAEGGKETVRDYIKKIGEQYFNKKNN